MTSPWLPQSPNIEWLDGTPRSRQFEDVYFSQKDGLDESRYVFVHNNELPNRFAKLTKDHFWIAETGFGSGLNFLATWQAWTQYATRGKKLIFSSTELYPLSRSDIQTTLSKWPELQPLAQRLTDLYPERILGQHRIHLSDDVILDLHFGDAAAALAQWLDTDHPGNQSPLSVDAWFLDGFTPARNELLWAPVITELMAKLSGTNTTFATFTASSQVRRNLVDCGFSIIKKSGYGTKRELMTGSFNRALNTPPPEPLPWHAPQPIQSKPGDANAKVIHVIGSGIAGASIALALAKRGRKVVVLEASDEIAHGASGNDQGILYTRLSPSNSVFSRFVLHSFLYALRYYAQFDNVLNRCGMLLADGEEANADLLAAPDLVRWVNAKTASALAGFEQKTGGLFFEQAGWLSPKNWCELALTHPNITVEKNHLVTTLPSTPTVIANAYGAKRWFDWLPLRPIRGQVTQVCAEHGVKSVVCGKHFVIPTSENTLATGATYSLNDPDTSIREADTKENLNNLLEQMPSLKAPEIVKNRAGIRAASPDYLPLVGQLPHRDKFIAAYGNLRKDARTAFDQIGDYVPNLYLNIGYGSRGLSYAPLCAELLAAQMCGEARPIEADIAKALAPARFIVRDLKRGVI